MSDTFDHMTDAYESLDWDYGDSQEGGYYGRASNFHYDPLYYHTPVQYMGVVAETGKAILFDINDHTGDYKIWIPKSLIKGLDRKGKTMYVHSKSLPILTRI